MNGKELTNGEEPIDVHGRLPVAPPEIGPADFADLIDFHVDSDEDLDFLENDVDSDDEMEPLQIVPYQAAHFLVNVAAEQEIVQVPGHVDDIEADNEIPLLALQSEEVPGDLSEGTCDYVAGEEAQSAEVEANTHENQQPMELVAGIENKSVDIEPDNQQQVEHQALEMTGELVGKVEEQGNVSARNRLDQEQNPALHADSPHKLGEDQELDSGSSASNPDQDLYGESASTSQVQEYEINERPSGSGEDPIEQFREGVADCGAAMERLKVYEEQPDIQVPPIRGEGQENMADQIEEIIQDVRQEESGTEGILHEGLNGGSGGSNSDEPPEDQQDKIIQMSANEEAALEPVQEQVEEGIEDDPNGDFVMDEQDNLVEEIVQEGQVVPACDEPAGEMDPGVDVVPNGELAGEIEPPDYFIDENGNVEYDPFIHMTW